MTSFPGRCDSTEPGISRFSGAQLRTVVRSCGPPRNDGSIAHTGFTTTRNPSRGLGIGHICHCAL